MAQAISCILNFVKCTGFIVWITSWTNSKLTWTILISWLVCCDAINYFSGEYKKSDVFQTHCKLLKFIIRDMLFPTKLTSLINTRGLIDSASLEIITITDVTVGATSDLKLFWGGVYKYLKMSFANISSSINMCQLFNASFDVYVKRCKIY